MLFKFKFYYFDYPITRQIRSRRFTVLFLAGLIIVCVFVTLFAVIAVAYEPVSVLYTSFNATRSLWYDRFHSRWLPQTTVCQPSVMKVNEGYCFSICRN